MLACLTPDPSKRSPILLAGFAGGWFLSRPGLQTFTVIPDSEEPWKRATVPFATSVASWSTVMLAATAALRRTRLPVPIAAVVLGDGLVVVDSLLADLGEARDAAKAGRPERTRKRPASVQAGAPGCVAAGDVLDLHATMLAERAGSEGREVVQRQRQRLLLELRPTDGRGGPKDHQNADFS